MLAVLDFFFKGHDLVFVALAAAVCLLSAYACVSLLRHAKRMEKRARLIWTTISALSVGLGIWSTHFVAMLAFRPGYPLQYDILLTATSLLLAIAVCGAGLSMAIRATGRADRFLGGAVVGVGISTMHYVGIAALLLDGQLVWNGQLVGVSIIAGIVLSGLAVVVAMGAGRRRLLSGAGLLTLAICAMHFTAMGASDFSNCMPLVHDGLEIDGGVMSVIVALITLVILSAALGSIVLDEADRRRTEREELRQKADAERLAMVSQKLELALTHMGQGLALFSEEGRVLLHNERLLELLGLRPEVRLEGLTLADICVAAMNSSRIEPAKRHVMAKELAEQHQLLAAQGGQVVHTFDDERFLRVQHNPIGDGRWVTLMEDISDSKRSEAAIAHLAKHDTLTGLPNRARFDEVFSGALADAEGNGTQVGVVAIDLDNFKDINDTYGHATGDQVLRVLSERLSGALRPGEVVARLGGDEFVAIKQFSVIESMRDFLERIEGAIFGSVHYQDVMVATSGSIGVAIYPQDGTENSKLLSNADLALYRAKAEFETRVCYYESEMDEHARQRRAMANDLWLALEQDGFSLVYQVQRSVSTGAVTGYEVLLRWHRPGYGTVSPAEFIPVAEECGAINAIGAWVLKTACMEAAAWPEQHKIAVNVSGLQLAQVELVDLVKMVLEQSGLAPERLELEVTETAIITDKKRALSILRRIRELGVSIAIDDFGTGYSSLATLRSFPFDKIKLDRSFMNEVEQSDESKAIVRAILALGRSLSVPVLAEGVETIEQLHVLQAEGCNEAQGFLLGRPAVMDWSEEAERSIA
ncbi:EAL domain-containing protein [Devosia sp.]|uniref:EAL domain-containing protein n=1 Tax=Devosia sp. TaxID=1871048 RepID=UPI001AC193FC|nr:EAL domain-containing protein [Devosia sp.]MBN9334927.1 EAL domain-containing protein [Devosia sp.]